MTRIRNVAFLILFPLFCVGTITPVMAQINTNRVLAIGKNALYFEDYVLSIQYFNQVIKSKPYLAEPYLYRGIAKLSLDDYSGAEGDLTLCLERNPFLFYAYLYRGIALQSQNNFDGAIENYDKGLEFRPENRQMLINKGIAFLQKKSYDEALETLDRLVAYQPKLTQAYLTRGAVYIEKGDTLTALADFDKALELDKFYAPAYGQRAMIYFMQEKFEEALADYNEAIRLEPKQIGYYINRGLVRYNLNDLRGAMTDYDAVVTLESHNTIARFNRGLLRSQVGDVSGAVEDFNVVIRNEPDNYMAIYNRAILNEEAKNYRDAVSDLDLVLTEYPYFVPGYYFRAEVKRKMRDVKGADADYWFAYDMEQKLLAERTKGKVISGKEGAVNPSETTDDLADVGKKTRERSDKNIEKFNRLVMYDREEEIKSSYSDDIRGRVQDKQVKVDLEPQFVITYYEKRSEIDHSPSRFDKFISEYNARTPLKLQLRLTNQEASLTDQQAEYHFKSIDDYSLVIDRDPANSAAYFGRALDFMLLQDLTEAIDDFTRVINMDPDFFPAYFNRAVVRLKQMELTYYEGNADRDVADLTLNIHKPVDPFSGSQVSPSLRSGTEVLPPLSRNPDESRQLFEMEQIMRDYARVIELNPDFVYAYFNRGNICSLRKDFRAALADYNEAIARNPQFGEAYYNRGLTRLYLGDTERGIADLSKAGELGVVNAYSIIKKMTAE